jgi:Nucleotidyltransferase
MPPDDELAVFFRLIAALRPLLDRVVIIGGWAHRLYRYRTDAIIPDYAPLFTSDADVVIPSNTVLPKTLRKQLLANGFAEEFLGEDRPPVTHYRLTDASSEFYAEFLTPLLGGGGRPGKTSDTVEIGGVVAQKLRYLEILTIDSWRIGVDAPAPAGQVVIRVVNAVSYIAQKLLIQGRRHPSDQARDIIYIHDTIELFGASLGELRQLWLDSIRPQLPSRVAGEIRRRAREFGRGTTEPGHRAARQATLVGRELTSEAIQLVCEEGLAQLFD